MGKILKNITKIPTYIPIALVAILFVADIEVHSHLKKSMWGIGATFLSIIFVYFLMRTLKVNRYFALAISFIVWLGLILGNKFILKIGHKM